jgi:hypothetical protein
LIVNALNRRFNYPMFSDSRLVNEQGKYCLCTRCSNTSLDTDEDQTHICKRHDDFIEMTTKLQLASPVFACPEFKERPDKEDLILIGLQRELANSTKEELTWVISKLVDQLAQK